MSKYIIRYTYGEHIGWRYFVRIAREDKPSSDTCSTGDSDTEEIMKMTLQEAEDKVIKIKKIRMKGYEKIKEIQILNAETKEIIDNEPKPTTRFELMDI